MLPVSVLLLQVLAAIFAPTSVFKPQINAARPSVAVLIPAHNEALVIAKTIQTILPQLAEGDQLLVVADNCNDDTTSIAKNLGANVVERFNTTLRGKGYALDYGIQYLHNKPPQVVMIVDADCNISAHFIQVLAQASVQLQRPVQALDLMLAPANPSLKMRIAEFAWLVKNKVRPLGFKALGLPCQLMGTGMAFLWQDISTMSLANGHIAEDMKLGIDFCRADKAAVFIPDVLVTSLFPQGEQASTTQRARWEHGHLGMIISEAPSLILESIKTRNVQMFGLACDLIVPPLAVLVLLCLAVFIASAIAQAQLALMISSLLLIALAMAVLLAWLFFGRAIISFRQLCYAPIYAMVKIPLYIKFFLNRQVEWVRSKRD
ncbi:MAG: glycosyltransferase family 2 protein [Bdellovibrio sp.]|nr:glycosyltransferase family 2 protein [Methylotenera sp.]